MKFKNVKNPFLVISLTLLLFVTTNLYINQGKEAVRVGSMDISPDGTTLAVSINRSWREPILRIVDVSDINNIRFYELDTWKHRDIEIPREANSIAYTKEGSLLAVYPDYTRIAVWNVEGEHSTQRSIVDRNEERARPFGGAQLFISPDNNYLASAEINNVSGTLKIFSIANGELITRIDQEYLISAVSISSDGEHIAAGDSYGNVRVWDLVSAELVKVVVERSAPKYGGPWDKGTTGLAYSHKGKLLATSSPVDGIAVWDTNTQEIQPLWNNQNGGTAFVAFSPDDTLVAVHTFSGFPFFELGSIAKTEVPIKLRSTDNGEVIATLSGAGNSISFSAASDTVYTGGPGDIIRVWDVHSGLETKRVSLKIVENWLIISAALGVIWFIFWLWSIHRDGFLGSLHAPLLAIAITVILTPIMWISMYVVVRILLFSE